MIAKSPCINVCKLNPKNNLCEGCLRTSEEISNWSKYSDNKKKNIISILKNRKLTTLIVLFLIFFNECFSNELWVGKWKALDKWQSEFLIEINDDGTALLIMEMEKKVIGQLLMETYKLFGNLELRIIFSVELWVIKGFQKVEMIVIPLE